MLILKPSRIRGAGVGVFTTCAIRRGERVPLFARRDYVFVKRPTRHLRRYCVTTKGGYWAPRNVHRMSIGWYINDAQTRANIDARRGVWLALRYIRSGEELTIDYGIVDMQRAAAIRHGTP